VKQITHFGNAFDSLKQQIADFEAESGMLPFSPSTSFSERTISKGLSHVSPNPASFVSSFAQNLRPSKTVTIHAMTKKLEAEGVPIIGTLCVGEPDFPPAKEVLDALKEGTELPNGKGLRYTAVGGTIELRKAICEDLERRKGVVYTPDQVVVSNGGKQAIYQALLATVEPNDEVIIPTPSWTSYVDIVRMVRANPVLVERSAKTCYSLDVEKVRRAVTSKTKIIILCNPCNPTGSVFPRETLEGIAEIVRNNPQILVLSDEIYEMLTYDIEHVCFSVLPGMRERTLLINGFSKGHAMTGLRLGYLCAPLPIAAAATKIQSQFTWLVLCL